MILNAKKLRPCRHVHPNLAEMLEGEEYEIGGDEHLVVRVDEQADRVFKLTHGDCFGCYSFFPPHDPDLTGKHFRGSINEDPISVMTHF